MIKLISQNLTLGQSDRMRFGCHLFSCKLVSIVIKGTDSEKTSFKNMITGYLVFGKASTSTMMSLSSTLIELLSMITIQLLQICTSELRAMPSFTLVKYSASWIGLDQSAVSKKFSPNFSSSCSVVTPNSTQSSQTSTHYP